MEDNILDIFDGYLEASLILDREVGTEVVVELLSRQISFEETDSSEISSILTNEDVILIEKTYSESYGEAYFIEGLIYKGEQSDVISNVVFIQDTVLDEIDDGFIYSDEIYVFSYFDEDEEDIDWQEEVNDICNGNCEECNCNDEYDGDYDEEVESLLDGLVEDFMEQLRDLEDFSDGYYELLKGYLMEAFEYGEEYGAETIISDLQNKYDL
jgi:hypothetical protein